MSFHSLTLLASLLVCADPIELERGTLLTYSGEMAAEKGDADSTRKSFELAVLVQSRDDSGARIIWRITENGHGGWTWPNRLGSLQLAADWRGSSSHSPALLYSMESSSFEVPLPLPFLAGESPLQEDASWRQDGYEHIVAAEVEVDGRPAWQVEVRGKYGLKRVVAVDQRTPVALALKEKTTIGRGDDFAVRYQLQAVAKLSEEETAQTEQGLKAWETLIADLKFRPPSAEKFTALQFDLLEKQAPAALPALQASSLLAPLAEAIATSIKQQQGEQGLANALRNKIVGEKAGEFSLPLLEGEAVTAESLAGRVAVLHFWPYRHAPLAEPYGQIGYLDFLYRRHKNRGLKVIGVHVDERLAKEEERRASLHSAKKLQEFMRMGYPLAYDDGAVLANFGDPRQSGLELPLFVVIGRDGAVLHYHVGYYEVDRDKGLGELDAAVTKALDAK